MRAESGADIADGWDQDAATVVVAHQLLGTVGVIRGLITALRRQGDQLSAEQREATLAAMDERAEWLSALLSDIVRGVPLEALRILSVEPEVRLS